MPRPGFPAGWGLSVHLREVPMRTREDALALFPSWFRDDDGGPVRDALADALVETWAKFASRQAAYAASANEQYAVGRDLDLLGAQKEIPRALGEDDRTYRARLLADEDIAAPRAILAAIDRILARVTTKQAVYWERPQDDAFVFSKADTSTRGTYIGAPKPIVNASRAYDARGRCTPRKILLWQTRRRVPSGDIAEESTTDTNLNPVVRSFNGDNSTASTNGHGHAIIALPAFLQPSLRKPSSAFIFSKADTQQGPFTFAKATVATRHGMNLSLGAAVYSRVDAATVLVGAIQAMLAKRSMFGTKFTLLFDPSL